MSSSQPSHLIYEKEEKIKIDYTGLNDNLQDLDDGDDVKKVEKKLEKQINDLASTIHRIQVRTTRMKRYIIRCRHSIPTYLLTKESICCLNTVLPICLPLLCNCRRDS
jgi:hypothetical protein